MSDVHPRDRLAYWHDVACKVLVNHECRIAKRRPPSTRRCIRARSATSASSTSTASVSTLRRVTKRNIAQWRRRRLPTRACSCGGSATLIQDGREAILQPGDFALLDAQRPYVCHYSATWRQLIAKNPASGAEGAAGARARSSRRAPYGTRGDRWPRVGLHAHDSATCARHTRRLSAGADRRAYPRSRRPCACAESWCGSRRRYRRGARSRSCNCARRSKAARRSRARS